jgi:hypothetical protein
VLIWGLTKTKEPAFRPALFVYEGAYEQKIPTRETAHLRLRDSALLRNLMRIQHGETVLGFCNRLLEGEPTRLSKAELGMAKRAQR